MSGYLPMIAGFAAGVAASMGLGGGFVLILYLVWAGVPAEEARAANLMFFIPVSLVSMLMNRRSGLIDFSVIPYAAAAGSIGAVIGLVLGSTTDPDVLGKCFAVLLMLTGLRELFHRKGHNAASDAPSRVPYTSRRQRNT